MSIQQQSVFQDRVARIRAQHAVAEQSWARSRPTSPLENAKYPLGVVMAFVAGAVAMMLGRYCQFHMLGMPAQTDNPDIQLVMDNVLAGMVAVVIRLAFSYTTREHVMANMAGVWLAILTFHNLPHWTPAPMSMAFSSEYVRQVKAETSGNSILFRGMEFHFGRTPVFAR